MKYQMKAYTPDGIQVLGEFNDVDTITQVGGGMILLNAKGGSLVAAVILISGTWLEVVPAIIH